MPVAWSAYLRRASGGEWMKGTRLPEGQRTVSFDLERMIKGEEGEKEREEKGEVEIAIVANPGGDCVVITYQQVKFV